MDDTGLSQISNELPVPELAAMPTHQDIPEAVREVKTATQLPLKRSPALLLGIGGLGLFALMTIPLILSLRARTLTPWGDTAPTTGQSSPTTASPAVTTSGTPASGTDKTDTKNLSLLGHLPYTEAAKDELEPITPDGGILLHRSAAEKFKAMAAAAAEEGILLMPLSGFRSVPEQESIFFDVKAERGEVATKRAEVSAPPGYSEHHTGYAIDIGDGDHPGADLQLDFEETEAFKWLTKNAAYYSFEMSFPKNNPMGVSYEPWHWRFVGDRKSLETFYRAKTNQAGSTSSPGASSPGASSPGASPPGASPSSSSSSSSSSSADVPASPSSSPAPGKPTGSEAVRSSDSEANRR